MKAPCVVAHPNTFAWFCLVMKFKEPLRAAWPAPQASQPQGGKGGKKSEQPAPKKVEENPPAEEKADDDEMDLLGSDDEEDVRFAGLTSAGSRQG